MRCILYLEDGTLLTGRNFGAKGTRFGELIFNTGMTGYQEILTDPSYKGQIVIMTYPHVGNYGINFEDPESRRCFLEGFVIRELCNIPSNFRSKKSLQEYLEEKGIVGIERVDTRFLTMKVREKGAMRAILTTEDADIESLRKAMEGYPGLVGIDLVKEVTCSEPYEWTEDLWKHWSLKHPSMKMGKFKVVVYDFGVKRNILRSLVEIGCDVYVVPAFTQAEEVLGMNPDGVLLSNGPGDPAPVEYAQQSTKKLIGKIPIFGICLGHQILGLAEGAKTFKLKFGHHGINHPVKDLKTGRIEITSQNHGFAVDPKTLDDIKPTHVSLNDRTLEGMEGKMFFSVQYHPEAAPGPHDSSYLFQRFGKMMLA